MKEYDIFLKQRLTEGSIIVYSLPFRDGISAVNRVVLRAMLSYFSLQKKIAVANQSALLSEIDEMLATVSEKIGDQVCLEASAALTIKYRNELEQAAMRLDIPAFTLFAQSFFALESQIGIKVSQPIAYAKSSLGDAQSAMAIVAKSLAEQKQVFDTIQNQTVLVQMILHFGNTILSQAVVRSVLTRQARSCFIAIQQEWRPHLRLRQALEKQSSTILWGTVAMQSVLRLPKQKPLQKRNCKLVMLSKCSTNWLSRRSACLLCQMMQRS